MHAMKTEHTNFSESTEVIKPLTPEEKETLRRWVEAGAVWEGHWAFEPLREAPLPFVRDAAWPRNAMAPPPAPVRNLVLPNE